MNKFILFKVYLQDSDNCRDLIEKEDCGHEDLSHHYSTSEVSLIILNFSKALHNNKRGVRRTQIFIMFIL